MDNAGYVEAKAFLERNQEDFAIWFNHRVLIYAFEGCFRVMARPGYYLPNYGRNPSSVDDALIMAQVGPNELGEGY